MLIINRQEKQENAARAAKEWDLGPSDELQGTLQAMCGRQSLDRLTSGAGEIVSVTRRHDAHAYEISLTVSLFATQPPYEVQGPRNEKKALGGS